MGVKNLIKLIEKYSLDAIKYTNICDYTNKTIGIDANLLLYKLIFGIRVNGYDIKNGDIVVTHIHTLLLKLIAFKCYNINPVFVFDSLPPEIKYATLEQRKKTKKNLMEKYKDSTTDKGKRIYYYIKTDLTSKEFNDCRQLITLFDYTIIDAKEEADAQLVQLYNAKLVDFIASDDMDILLFGGGVLLKKFSIAENKKIQQITLSVILNDAKITMDQFIQIGILMGTDYCNNKNFSASKAYQLIKDYGSMNNIPDAENCDNAFDYFKTPPVLDIDSVSIYNNLKSRELINFLKTFNFKEKYIEKIFENIRDSG